MASHPSILAWRIPQTEEPGGLQSLGSQRIKYDLAAEQQTILYIVLWYKKHSLHDTCKQDQTLHGVSQTAFFFTSLMSSHVCEFRTNSLHFTAAK